MATRLYVKCAACNGGGKGYSRPSADIDWPPCRICDGTGKLIVMQMEVEDTPPHKKENNDVG